MVYTCCNAETHSCFSCATILTMDKKECGVNDTLCTNTTTVCNISVMEERWGPQGDPIYMSILVTVMLSIVFVTGFVGNVVTLYVISTNKALHTATNYYLGSLAVSDLLLLLTGFPQEIYLTWYKYPYIFGEIFGDIHQCFGSHHCRIHHREVYSHLPPTKSTHNVQL